MQQKFIQSKLYRFLDYLLRLVLINFLIVIPSFSFLFIFSIFFKKYQDTPWIYITFIPIVFYLFPAICCGFDLFKQYELNETNTVFKDYFLSLKRNYVKSLLASFIILIVGGLLSYSTYFFYQHLDGGFIYLLGFFFAISFCVMALVLMIHIPLVFAYFKGITLIDSIKLAFLFGFKDFLGSILSVIITITMVALSIWNNYILILIGFSLPICLIVKITVKRYIKILRKVE